MAGRRSPAGRAVGPPRGPRRRRPLPRTVILGDVKVRLGRKGDYAVRAVLFLARRDVAGLRKAREITEEMGVPASYLPAILAQLVGAGLVTSTAGREGGYALARAPEEVTLLEVLEAVEGPVSVSECVLRGGPCSWEHECAVHRFWAAAQDAFRDELATTTFADIAARDAEL